MDSVRSAAVCWGKGQQAFDIDGIVFQDLVCIFLIGKGEAPTYPVFSGWFVDAGKGILPIRPEHRGGGGSMAACSRQTFAVISHHRHDDGTDTGSLKALGGRHWSVFAVQLAFYIICFVVEEVGGADQQVITDIVEGDPGTSAIYPPC